MKRTPNLNLVWSVMLFLLLGPQAFGAWVRVGENGRFVAYVDTPIRRSGDTATYWVLFDYKTVQESPRSGRRYLSEKAQHEIECRSERDRTIFFTWHAEHMGNGVVVYTGNRPINWEPTSSPDSIGNAFWKFVCGRP